MPVGKTKDAGWQIGVSTTVDHPIDDVWRVLTSAEGTAIWLGDGGHLDGEIGQRYETLDGTVGELRSYRPHDRVRFTWQPVSWDHETTVQIAMQSKGPRTLLRFHQERLADSEERERQRVHWKTLAARIVELLDRWRDTDRSHVSIEAPPSGTRFRRLEIQTTTAAIGGR